MSSTAVVCLIAAGQGFHKNLVSLELSKMDLSFAYLQAISEMPKLGYLQIHCSKISVPSGWLPTGFLALRSLKLSFLRLHVVGNNLSFYESLLALLADQLVHLEVVQEYAMMEDMRRDLCVNVKYFPKLVTLAATATTILLLLSKGSLPVVRHIVIRQCTLNSATEPSLMALSGTSFVGSAPLLARALQQRAPSTIQSVELEECRPAYIATITSKCSAVHFTVHRLQVVDALGCTQLAMASCRHLRFGKGIEAAHLVEMETLRFYCPILETIEFADERQENQLFLEKLYAPGLTQVRERAESSYSQSSPGLYYTFEARRLAGDSDSDSVLNLDAGSDPDSD